MAVVVPGYVHRVGEHCASTALRNLLAFRGTDISEAMVFGLGSGLGFVYIESPGLSPTRLFHGRTATLESDLGDNTGIDLVDRDEPDDEVAWQELRRRIAAGEPVMISTDTFYLGYHQTTSHFPGHRCVAVGYDDDTRTVWIADRKFPEYQRCSFEELRAARNAVDHPMPCLNRYGDFGSRRGMTRPLPEAIAVALARNARGMLEPGEAPYPVGIPGIRVLAGRLASWETAPDWSWCARFGYQIVVKRGAGGSFFRSLEADFLREAAAHVPELGEADLPARMDEIAAGWHAFAAALFAQSERETCDPELFRAAGRMAGALADAEESLFTDALALAQRLGVA
jgi:hypothetical protein